MELIRAADAVRALADARRDTGEQVGLVPTMGALHAGHASLIRAAREMTDLVVISIFVNPLQFGPEEDFESYPRPLEQDLATAEELGVDAVWAPSVEEMYPTRDASLPGPEPGRIGDLFEGAARPGHFVGVLRAVRRLFDVTGPCDAYFGEKDVQQLFLIRRMVADDALPITVVACPTARESDGLAVSSRNAFLGAEEREQAGCLFLALSEAAELARKGEPDARVLVATMAREVGATPLARLDYAAVVDEATFEPVDAIEAPARAVIAARFPSARLIDNMALPSPD